jgi:hypothetical protein
VDEAIATRRYAHDGDGNATLGFEPRAASVNGFSQPAPDSSKTEDRETHSPHIGSRQSASSVVYTAAQRFK